MARDQEVKNQRSMFDRRTVERNIKKGLFTRKDYEKHLKALDDVADKGVYGGSDVDDDDDDIIDDEPDEGATEPQAGAPTN